MSVAPALARVSLPIANTQSEQSACSEWSSIAELYRRTAIEFSEAVASLPFVPGAEFNQAWQRAERARKKCDDTRTALLDHEYNHDCVAGRLAL